MRYIIMCGGNYSAWDTPRQLTVVCGETLVGRTIRLLKEAGVDDIAISTDNDAFLRFGVPLLRHFNDFNTQGRGYWVEAFYPMEEPACYLMGDVFYSQNAIDTIVHAETKGIAFFASTPPFPTEYIKPWAEPFGFKVTDQKRFRAAIDFVKANEKTGIFLRRPIAWELWQVINGENVRTINYNNYIAINDYTCDIDQKQDALLIEAMLRE